MKGQQIYFVALALLNQGGERILPLGGRNLRSSKRNSYDLPDDINKIILELLMRIIQKSKKIAIKLDENIESLIVIEIDFVTMQTIIPTLKQDWIRNGDTSLFLDKLKKECLNMWYADFKKYEGISYKKIID